MGFWREPQGLVRARACAPRAYSGALGMPPVRLRCFAAQGEGDLLLLVDPVDTAVRASEVAERIPHFVDASDFAEELASCGGELG